MKIPSRGRLISNWPSVGAYTHGKTQAGPLSMKGALYYVLSLPVSTVIIGCDNVAQLEENVKLAREFTPLSEPQLAVLSARTVPIARVSLPIRLLVRKDFSLVEQLGPAKGYSLVTSPFITSGALTLV